MIDPVRIREYLIEHLEPIFGKPKNADGLAATLAKHVPDHATDSGLAGLAERIIASRKAKGFPSASELIVLVKLVQPPSATVGAAYISDTGREKQISEAEERGRRLLRGTELARRAVDERWAPGLLEFARDNGRAPGADEERPIIAMARKNDALAKENAWVMGGAMTRLRELMHWRAARDLGFDMEAPPDVAARGRSMRSRRPPIYQTPPEIKVSITDPAALAPSSTLLQTLGQPAMREAAE